MAVEWRIEPILDTLGNEFWRRDYHGRWARQTSQLRREYTAIGPLYWNGEQTGSNAMDISDVAYSPEICEDLPVDDDVRLGPRG